MENFKHKISNTSWDTVYLETNADDAYNYFMQQIEIHSNDCFPGSHSFKKQRQRLQKLWFTDVLLKMLRKKKYKNMFPIPFTFIFLQKSIELFICIH